MAWPYTGPVLLLAVGLVTAPALFTYRLARIAYPIWSPKPRRRHNG